MMRPLVVIALASLLLLASGELASADPGDNTFSGGASAPGILALIGNDDVFSVTDLSVALAAPLSMGGSGRTQHYGPFASGSPDSGTCGNDWAQDTFDRHFTVRPNGDGTFTIVEQFKNGEFVTVAGLSPGACDVTDGTPPGTIRAGVSGDMHGYLVWTVTGTQTSQDPSCVAGMPNAPCTGADFVATHFAGVSGDVTTFFFHYSAGDQGLVEHEWKNASSDRGGNHGDIADVQP